MSHSARARSEIVLTVMRRRVSASPSPEVASDTARASAMVRSTASGNEGVNSSSPRTAPSASTSASTAFRPRCTCAAWFATPVASLHVRQQELRAPPPAGLLVADESKHQLTAPGVAELRQGDERERERRHPRLHVAGAAPVDAPVLHVPPERVVLPPGLANRKRVEVPVQHEPALAPGSAPRD